VNHPVDEGVVHAPGRGPCAAARPLPARRGAQGPGDAVSRSPQVARGTDMMGRGRGTAGAARSEGPGGGRADDGAARGRASGAEPARSAGLAL